MRLPERRAARILRAQLNELAPLISAEAGSRTVRIVAEFRWSRPGKATLEMRVYVSKDAANERGPRGRVQPSGTSLISGAEAAARRKMRDLDDG